MAAPADFSVSDLLAKAEELLQSMENVPLAEKFYAKALTMEPNNTTIMDDYAECLLELGDIDTAAELIKRSIDLDPEGGYQKYMIAGQLAAGIEALTCFNKGIDVLQRLHKECKAEGNAQSTQELAQHISSAYCSMAEIFMTDCCFEEGAEAECTRVIEEALKWNFQSVEAHLLRSQCLLAKSEPTSALPCVLTSYSLWKDEDESKWPMYAVRVSTAKILLEVGQIEDSVSLLEQLTHEDDEDSEIWYLLGLCYFNMADEDSESLMDAKECLQKSLRLLKRDEEQMPDAIEKAQSLLKETNDAITNGKQTQNMDVN